MNIASDMSLKLYSSAAGRFSSRFENTAFTQIREGAGEGGSGSPLTHPRVCPFRLPSLSSLFMQTSLDVYEKLIPNSWSTKTWYLFLGPWLLREKCEVGFFYTTMNSLAVEFPTLLIAYTHAATWNLSDSLSYLYQLIIIIINIIIIIIITYYYYYYHYFYWILSRSSSIHLWSSNLFPPCCMHCIKTCTAGSYCGCNSSSTHLPE